MNAEDLADKIVNLFRDQVIGEEIAERLRGQLLIVIAAAVAAEHRATLEQAAKVAYGAVMKINTGTNQMRDTTMAELRGICADKAADSIRALK